MTTAASGDVVLLRRCPFEAQDDHLAIQQIMIAQVFFFDDGDFFVVYQGDRAIYTEALS
jgi:hypothetical protein